MILEGMLRSPAAPREHVLLARPPRPSQPVPGTEDERLLSRSRGMQRRASEHCRPAACATWASLRARNKQAPVLELPLVQGFRLPLHRTLDVKRVL